MVLEVKLRGTKSGRLHLVNGWHGSYVTTVAGEKLTRMFVANDPSEEISCRRCISAIKAKVTK